MTMENNQINWTLTAIDRASAMFKGVESGMGKLASAWGLIGKVAGLTVGGLGLKAIVEKAKEAEQVHILALSDARERQIDIRAEASQVARDALGDMAHEIELIGKTAAEVEKMNAVRAIDLKLHRDLRVAEQKKAGLYSLTYRLQLERNFVTGANAAFDQYIDHATNAAELSRDFSTHSFASMGDALMNFVSWTRAALRARLISQTCDAPITMQTTEWPPARAGCVSAATSGRGGKPERGGHPRCPPE